MLTTKRSYTRRPRRAALCGFLAVAALIGGVALLIVSVSDAQSASSVSSAALTATTADPAPTPANTAAPTTVPGSGPVSPAAQPAGTTGANGGSTPAAVAAPSSNAVSSSPAAVAPPAAPTTEIIVCESTIVDQNGVRTGSETAYRAAAGTPPPSGCHLG